MITTFVIYIGELLIAGIFALLDILPNMPVSVITTIDWLFDIMLTGVNIVGFFVDLNMVKILIPIVIAIINFDKIYHVIMFAIKKIPFTALK